jgi:hypothetical protein
MKQKSLSSRTVCGWIEDVQREVRKKTGSSLSAS